jgi:hypothetical protein
MTVEEIRKLREAVPFRPFNLVLRDGRKLPVAERYFIGISPTKRFMTHASADGGFEIVRIQEIVGSDYDVRPPGTNQQGAA